MPSTFLIHPSRRLVYARLWGPATADDVQTLRERIAADPSSNPTFDLLFDICDADLRQLPAEGVERLARTHPFPPSARLAIVADTSHNFGLARMFEIRRDIVGGSEPLRVVHALEEALAWLGLADFDPRVP